jgi:hypothetical protein
MTDRRHFIATLAACTVVHPLPALTSDPRKLKIGLISDVHKDIIHDADARMQAFVDAMAAEKVDAAIQLGDFCTPKPAHQAFRDLFHSLPCPTYHVIGNHEMDGGFSRDEVVAFLGMKSRYYSFDLAGFHFIVLDANDRPAGWKGGYPSHIAADQVDWLKQDLAQTPFPTFILSHQSLERPSCIDNQEAIRAILEAAQMDDGKRKVAACFNGHWHIDHERIIGGIPYLHLNSASYFWMGGQYKEERLPADLAKAFPWVDLTAPYVKPLFSVLEIDPAAGNFFLRACKSEWLGPSPEDLHYKEEGFEASMIRPEIRARSQALPG